MGEGKGPPLTLLVLPALDDFSISNLLNQFRLEKDEIVGYKIFFSGNRGCTSL